MIRIYKYCVLLFLFSACNKAEDRVCFKSIGEETSKIIPLEEFEKIKLFKKIKYTLVQDDSTFLKIKGGKNLINFISTKIQNGFLEIHNENTCNFLRNQNNKVEVEIHFKNLKEIYYSGSEHLICSDTLKLQALKFVVLDACGTFDLKIECDFLSGNISHGCGDYIVTGKTKNAFMENKSNGFCNIENLKTETNLKLVNESVGDMYVNVHNNNLAGYISGKGNIYYTGNPITNELEFYGSGQFIKKP
jgi:hypothetical protein